MSQENSNSKLYYLAIAISVALIFVTATEYASSQTTSQEVTEHTIQVSGYSEKSVVPDTAILNIGVVVQSQTAQEATDENAAIMSAVIEELKALGLEDKDIQTSFVSVYPEYDYEETTNIVGYSASNSLQVRTTMVDNVSQIIDRSTAAGANQIGGIAFSTSDEMQEELREELIAEAVDDALSKANILANSLNVEIAGVHSSSLSDSEEPIIYHDTAEVATEEDAASTPIQPGESTVSMSVQVTYLIE
ncbi:SIMPL domain-containing protein [Methanolobus sp. ZRKC2]|uniref:SIMPL domain-containing protein n=1 Tax=Methanolobus sp. ZRKC2 TaxID=3125783 RepID=UPI0032503127